MVITSTHAQKTLIDRAYTRLQGFFSWLKANAPQLTFQERWTLIVNKSMEAFATQQVPQMLPP